MLVCARTLPKEPSQVNVGIGLLTHTTTTPLLPKHIPVITNSKPLFFSMIVYMTRRHIPTTTHA